MIRPIIRDKKGSIFQLSYVVAFVLAIALIGLFVGFVSWKITEAYKDIQAINESDTAGQANANFGAAIPSITDTLVFLYFLGSTIALMIAASRTNFNIVILGLFFINLMLSIFIASGAVDIYQGFAQDPSLSVFSQKLTFTNLLFSKYTPLMIVLIGAVILIIMYGKSGSNISI